MYPKTYGNITVTSLDYHRNGVCGKGFYVALFTHQGKYDKVPRNMIGTVFNVTHKLGDGFPTAVFDVDLAAQGNIRFCENSWRGDNYHHDLIDAILDYQFTNWNGFIEMDDKEEEKAEMQKRGKALFDSRTQADSIPQDNSKKIALT